MFLNDNVYVTLDHVHQVYVHHVIVDRSMGHM